MPSIASLYQSLLLPAIHSTSSSNDASSIYTAASSPQDHDHIAPASDNKPSLMSINNVVTRSSKQSQDRLLGQDDHLLLSRQHLLSIVHKDVLEHHIDCARYNPDCHPLGAFINPAPDSTSQTPFSMNINPAQLEHQYVNKDQPIMSRVICPGRSNLYQFEHPFLINSITSETRIKPQESTSLISSYSSSASSLPQGAVLIRERNSTDERNIISSQLITGNINDINVDKPNSSSTTAAASCSSSSCTPRPRWCPTQEQIRVLESLFNAGTTTPSRDMIVEIASHLKQFGNIVEANVFYWFQNRKARAKRKLNISNNIDSNNSNNHHGRNGSDTSTIFNAAVTNKASINPTSLRSLQDTLVTSYHELDTSAPRSCKRRRRMATSQTDLQAAHAAVSVSPLHFTNMQSQPLSTINQPEFNTTNAPNATSKSNSPNIDQYLHTQLLPSESDDSQQSSSCNLMTSQLSLQSRNIDGVNGVRYDNSSLTAHYSHSIKPTTMSEAGDLASIFGKQSSSSSSIYTGCTAFNESSNGPTKAHHHHLDQHLHLNAPHLLNIIGTPEAASLHEVSQHIKIASHRQQTIEGNSAEVAVGISSTTSIETTLSDVAENTHDHRRCLHHHHHHHHHDSLTDPRIDKEEVNVGLPSTSESDDVVVSASAPSLDQYSSCGLPPLWEALAPFIN